MAICPAEPWSGDRDISATIPIEVVGRGSPTHTDGGSGWLARVKDDLRRLTVMKPVEMGDGHPVCAINRAVRIDLEIRAVARSDAADQNRLAAAMVVGGRQQGREVELIAFADREASAVTLVVVGDVIDDRRGRLRIGQCRGVEYEFVGAGTSSQSGAGPARDSVRQIVTAAGEVG